MELDLTPLEVLEMAQWIETRAAKYYRLLASRAPNPLARQMLLGLAGMEDEHEKTFLALREVLGTNSEMDEDSAVYTRVIAKMTLDVDAILTEAMTGQEPPDQIISKAIDFEKSTIVFLVSLRGMLNNPADHRKVDRIIREEVGHILSLSGYLLPAGCEQHQAANSRYAEERNVFNS